MTSGMASSLLRHRYARLSWLFALASIYAALSNGAIGYAQGNKVVRTAHSRERTKEFINDYANGLGWGESADPVGQPRKRNPAGQGHVDPAAFRPLIRGFADKTAQLTYSLNDQVGQIPGLRQIYTESLRLSGAAAGIQKRAEKSGVDGAMLDDLQQLDADWRELDYRLESVRGLSNDTADLAADINDVDQKIRQLIGIQPQFDRRQLHLKAAGLVADLDNLQDDITSELGRSQDSQFYRRSISRVRQAGTNLVVFLRDDHSDNATIVEQYQQFETQWTPLAAKLRAEDDRYVERSLRRVAASVGEIHELLLLPRKADPSQFVYLAKALKKDIDEFFDRTPLILIMRLPNAKQALSAADQFYNACSRFMDLVNQSQDPAQLAESFRAVDLAQRAFNEIYKDIDSDKALAVLNRIAQSANALRSSLQIQRDEFDYQSASELAASIQNASELIAEICKRWLEQDNQPFANNCLQECVDFAEISARLHDDIVDGKRPADLKDEMVEVYERCRRIYEYLAKCQTDDRQTLVRVSSSLTPALNELRSMVLQ